MSELPHDPFDILGLPARFDLAAAELRAAFLAKSAALHPDAMGAAADEGVGVDEDLAAALNEAKRVLTNPESRAEALLRRFGGPLKEEDRSLPPSFLHEMMELREEIEAAVERRDGDAITKWEEWAEERRRSHIKTVSGLFSDLMAGNGAASDEKDRDVERLAQRRAIRRELNMWRYVERLVESLDS